MTSLDSFRSRATLDVAGKSYTIYRLDALSTAANGNRDLLQAPQHAEDDHRRERARVDGMSRRGRTGHRASRALEYPLIFSGGIS